MIFPKFADFARAAGVALAFAIAGSASFAQPADAAEPSIDLAAELHREALFHSVAWKLVSANTPYCANTWALIGLTLGTPSTPGGPPVVISIAPNSPAERAGLRIGEEMLSISGADADWAVARAQDRKEQLSKLHRKIETLLERDGAITMTRVNALGERIDTIIEAQAVCPSRFLTREGKKIGADGVNVRFGLEFPGFAFPEDEFAAAIAHELAHNLMGHPYWLDREGRKRTNVRMTEREADRLMPWLLANAGYDPLAARRFMERWGPRHGGGLLRRRTHDGWDERAEFIDAEVAIIEQIWDEEGAADWQTHFRREEGLAKDAP